MDIQAQRVEMVTGVSIEEASAKLNDFLDHCGELKIEVQDIEYYPLNDSESKEKHSYLVRYDRYSQPFKEEYFRNESRSKIARAQKEIG